MNDLERENAETPKGSIAAVREQHTGPATVGYLEHRCAFCEDVWPCAAIRLTKYLERAWDDDDDLVDTIHDRDDALLAAGKDNLRLGRENAELRATIDRMAEWIAANLTTTATWQTAIQLERVGFDGAAIAEATAWGAFDEDTRAALRGVIREGFSAPHTEGES